MTTVVGVALARARAAVTIISREIPQKEIGSSVFKRGEARCRTRLFTMKKGEVFVDAEQVSKNLLLACHEMTNHGTSDPNLISAVGILEAPPLGTEASESFMEFLRLHTVVDYELGRSLGKRLTSHTIGSVRHSLGISGLRGIEGKKKMADMFRHSVSDVTDCSSSGGHQVMAESWGVAKLLDKQTQLTNFRDTNPSVIDAIREEVRRRRIFRDTTSGVKQEVIEDLLNAEVDKILMKRLSLT
jgi:hypothetical protein